MNFVFQNLNLVDPELSGIYEKSVQRISEKNSRENDLNSKSDPIAAAAAA